MRRTVLFDWHCSDYSLDVPGPVKSDAIDLPAHIVVGEVIGEQTQLFHRPVRHAFQTRSGIDIRKVNQCIVAVGLYLRWNDRRFLRLAQRQRFKQRVAVQLLDPKNGSY